MAIKNITMTPLSPKTMRMCSSCIEPPYIMTSYTDTLICDVLSCNNIPTYIKGLSCDIRKIERGLASGEYVRPSLAECRIKKLQLHIEYANKNIKWLKEVDDSIKRKRRVLSEYQDICDPIMDDDIWHDHRLHDKIVSYIMSEYADDIQELETMRKKLDSPKGISATPDDINQIIAKIEDMARELSSELLRLQCNV